MTPYIISVEPIDRTFTISWRIGIRCNYDCMYCSKNWHDNVSKNLSLEALQSAWQSIFEKTRHRNLKYKISFTGGEVTINRAFLPFLRWLRENYQDYIYKILVTSNGSASYNYYYRMLEYVDNITFSTHTEFIDEKKFFEMVIRLQKTKPKQSHISVAIMEEFWCIDKVSQYEQYLKKHGVHCNINKLDYSFKTRTIPIMKGNYNLDFSKPENL